MVDFLNFITYFLFFVFIFSAIPKFINIKMFIKLTVQYGVLPKFASKVYGMTLPFIEILAATLLIINRTSQLACIIIILLLSSFVIAVTIVLKNKKNISCGCSGVFSESQVDGFTIIKLLFLIFCVVILLINHNKYFISFNFMYLFIGLILTLLMFSAQKFWDQHKNTMKILKNT